MPHAIPLELTAINKGLAHHRGTEFTEFVFFIESGDDDSIKQLHPAGLVGRSVEVVDFVDEASWCAGCFFCWTGLMDRLGCSIGLIG